MPKTYRKNDDPGFVFVRPVQTPLGIRQAPTLPHVALVNIAPGHVEVYYKGGGHRTIPLSAPIWCSTDMSKPESVEAAPVATAPVPNPGTKARPMTACRRAEMWAEQDAAKPAPVKRISAEERLERVGKWAAEAAAAG